MSAVFSSAARQLQARQVIPTREFLPLENIEHLDFDGDGLRYLWVYRGGLTRQQPESQVFRVDLETLAFEVVALPEMLQRSTFQYLRLFGSQLLLLGQGQPSGFGLEPGGRIVESFHLEFTPKGMVLGSSGELWIGGDRPDGGVLQRWSFYRGILSPELCLSFPDLMQVSCVGPGPVLVGLDSESRVAFGCPSKGVVLPSWSSELPLPLALGLWRADEWLILDGQGQFWIQNGDDLAPLQLIDPGGESLGRFVTARIVGQTLLALEAAPSQRIFRFRPQ